MTLRHLARLDWRVTFKAIKNHWNGVYLRPLWELLTVTSCFFDLRREKWWRGKSELWENWPFIFGRSFIFYLLKISNVNKQEQKKQTKREEVYFCHYKWEKSKNEKKKKKKKGENIVTMSSNCSSIS